MAERVKRILLLCLELGRLAARPPTYAVAPSVGSEATTGDGDPSGAAACYSTPIKKAAPAAAANGLRGAPASYVFRPWLPVTTSAAYATDAAPQSRRSAPFVVSPRQPEMQS